MLVEAAQDDEHLRADPRASGSVSAMVVPLPARGRRLRRAHLRRLRVRAPLRRRPTSSSPRTWRAARRWRSTTRCSSGREHEAAVTLQRSLLPAVAARDARACEFAARYEPAAPGLEVGGDWYEVVAARRRRASRSTIGDVAGRGIQRRLGHGPRAPGAARLRRRRPPARRGAWRASIELIKESDAPEMTTLFHLLYDPRRRHARSTSAPAIRRRSCACPTARSSTLAGGGTPPLGILDEVECDQHPAELPPGSLLLLYTDGLIERRDATSTPASTGSRSCSPSVPGDAEDCLDALAERYRRRGDPRRRGDARGRDRRAPERHRIGAGQRPNRPTRARIALTPRGGAVR